MTNQKKKLRTIIIIGGVLLLVGCCMLFFLGGGGMGTPRSTSSQDTVVVTATEPVVQAEPAQGEVAATAGPQVVAVASPTLEPTVPAAEEERNVRASRSLSPSDFPHLEMWESSSRARFDRGELTALFGSLDLTVTDIPRSGNILEMQSAWGETLPFLLVGQQFPPVVEGKSYRYISWEIEPEVGRYPVRSCALVRTLDVGPDTEAPWVLATQYNGEQIIVTEVATGQIGGYEFSGTSYKAMVICYAFSADIEPIREMAIGFLRTPSTAEDKYEPLLLGWFIEFENR